jgi:hypothetical protein
VAYNFIFLTQLTQVNIKPPFVRLTSIDTSNHKAEGFSPPFPMEAKPEQRYHHDHVQEEAEKSEDAMEREGGLSLHPAGSTMFGRRCDEEAGGRRGEIREVDFFSRDSGARRQDGDGRRSVPGGGRDNVNVSYHLDHLLHILPSGSCCLLKLRNWLRFAHCELIGCSSCGADRSKPSDHHLHHRCRGCDAEQSKS